MFISDTEVLSSYPNIPIDHDSKGYWKGCLQNKLIVQKCNDCEHLIHYPSSICPECWSTNLVLTEMVGEGKIHSYIITHLPDSERTPFPIGIVELDKSNLRIIAPIINTKDITIGMPVKLTWIKNEGSPSLAFSGV